MDAYKYTKLALERALRKDKREDLLKRSRGISCLLFPSLGRLGSNWPATTSSNWSSRCQQSSGSSRSYAPTDLNHMSDVSVSGRSAQAFPVSHPQEGSRLKTLGVKWNAEISWSYLYVKTSPVIQVDAANNAILVRLGIFHVEFTSGGFSGDDIFFGGV
ncbi:hypothetical protein CHS0354_037598 [Potamilus streckersoni]|uniref:Uncharacterized protein n=1 Tax=Potamilus streckersoni TaxID=2493646 RepID=A0AAE0VL44_9BIVA|nr:hypothetical protein CHS0354_037598 [Potamilus streckersoni]